MRLKASLVFCIKIITMVLNEAILVNYLGTYSEVPNRRACSLRFLRFSFHPVCNFSCNKQKIPPCLFTNLLSRKAGRPIFFSKPARLFQSALLLGTSRHFRVCTWLLKYGEIYKWFCLLKGGKYIKNYWNTHITW